MVLKGCVPLAPVQMLLKRFVFCCFLRKSRSSVMFLMRFYVLGCCCGRRCICCWQSRFVMCRCFCRRSGATILRLTTRLESVGVPDDAASHQQITFVFFPSLRHRHMRVEVVVRVGRGIVKYDRAVDKVLDVVAPRSNAKRCIVRVHPPALLTLHPFRFS